MAKIDWNHHIEAWQASGLSQAAYCRHQGLNPNTFSSRLRAHRAWSQHTDQALIPVRIELPTPTATSEGVVLRMRQGHRLELSAAVSPRWLAELLQCLD